jgi:predicted 3-demethylubiquinone-9 3-methyltransferase (glyoxalase superfamily)
MKRRPHLPMQKLFPYFAFDKGAEDAIKFYVAVFKDSKIININYFGEDESGELQV